MSDNVMNEKVNLKKALRVFDTIVTKGQRDGDEYSLNGLTAFTDFDGYTATIKNDYVRLAIFFHNNIAFEYSSKKEKGIFLDKIATMDKQNSA